MTSTKKLKGYRRDQLRGTRRKKPSVRQLNRQVRERIVNERELFESLLADAEVRRELMYAGQRPEHFAVWNDCDQYYDLTVNRPGDLPVWSSLGQFIKFHLLFQIALDIGGYVFTVKVRPDLDERWDKAKIEPMDRIKRLTRSSLQQQDLAELEYCFILETHTKGGSKTKLHLHGFLVAEDPMVATRFKVAMESAIGKHPKGRGAAGISAKSGPEVEVVRAYDMRNVSKHGRGRWVNYITKHATKPDKRIPQKACMSRTGTQAARELWALIREEPLA